jgi:2-iminobutanoate/2-iminopropanoate deaminase
LPDRSGSTRHGTLVGGDDVGAQTRQAYENVGLALALAGATRADVAKVTTFLVRGSDRRLLQRARGDVRHPVSSGAYPPSTLLVVRRLVRPELLFEIEVIAVTD